MQHCKDGHKLSDFITVNLFSYSSEDLWYFIIEHPIFCGRSPIIVYYS
jgi:hypothetical protein